MTTSHIGNSAGYWFMSHKDAKELQSWCKGSNAPCLSSQAEDEERMIFIGRDSAFTGWLQSRRKKFTDFSTLFHSHNYTFPEVIATISTRNNDLRISWVIPHQLLLMLLTRTYCPMSHIAQINSFRAPDTLGCIWIARWTQSAKSVFPEVAQNSMSFPCSEKSLHIPGFPGLWPPCLSFLQCSKIVGWATVRAPEPKADLKFYVPFDLFCVEWDTKLQVSKIGHFRDVLPNQSTGIVLKKLNLTQQKQAIQWATWTKNLELSIPKGSLLQEVEEETQCGLTEL